MAEAVPGRTSARHEAPGARPARRGEAMVDLLESIESIRAATACFYAVDLHLHSPFSYDWDNSSKAGRPRNPDLDKIPLTSTPSDASIAAYRQACCDSGRCMAAVTDHNVSSFGLQVVASNDKDELTVLPGIEMCVVLKDTPLIKDLRIHVLAVFPEDMHQEAFARVLPKGTEPEDKRDPRGTLAFKSVDELIDRVHAERGIAIAAHVESSNGLRGVYKNTTELLLEPIGGTPEEQEVLRRLGDQVKDELVKFDAIQVKPTTEASHYAGPDGTLRVPLIVATDCQKGCDLCEDQSHKYAYIKMRQPSFDAMREALQYPDVRIRLKADVPQAAPPRLLGLRLHRSEEAEHAFFEDTVLGFSDNLTCLIGPRGSGKSAAIDALRYLMGYNRSLDQIRKVSDQVEERQRATLEKTRIEALYQSADGKLFRLAATYDPHEDYVTEVFDLEGNRIEIDDVEASGEFPINLYGWGELELLAEDPETQRELLDRFIPDVGDLKDKKGAHYKSLATNTSECLDHAGSMEEYFTDKDLSFNRLHEYKRDFDALNTSKIKTVFEQLDAIQARRTVLKKIKQSLDRRLKGDVTTPLDIAQMLEGDGIKDWAPGFAARLKPESLDDWLRETNIEHQKRLETALAIVATEDDKLAREEIEAEKEIKAAIGEDEAITGDLRKGAKQRYETAKANYADYKKLYGEFKALLAKRQGILSDIQACERQVFAAREQAISQIRSEVSLVKDADYQVDLVLNQQADRRRFVSALYGAQLEYHGNYRAEKRPEAIAEKTTPTAFVRAMIDGDTDKFLQLVSEPDGKKSKVNHADRLIADNRPVTDLEGFDVPRVGTEQLGRLLRLEEVAIDDEFYITLGGKPIQHCSPGQRCSAMLPIVTLTTQAPLVIDQPEDNLDNRLVSRALFKILARLKETRQIIVATHNPNILVSGDAEQVLLLKSDGNVECYGCIDDLKIVDSVISLMEGGIEAFEKRSRKYAPYLPKH